MEKDLEAAQKQKSDSKYKDTLFRTLFQEKERAIELCNAVAGTNYPKDANVMMCGMENALLNRYNDLAFAVEGQLILMCEHQSTPNPNMPLRFLQYIADALNSWFVDMKQIYKDKLHQIPTPQFYVLYNGEKKLDYKELKLSDAFKIKLSEQSLELIVKILDVNYGSGSEVLRKSKSLDGYANLVAKIRGYQREGKSRDNAIKLAIEECIEQGILQEYLRENFEGVIKMLSWEYDKDVEAEALLEQGMEIGMERGLERGLEKAAINMLKSGFDAATIAGIVNMPIEWVEGLLTDA